MAVWEDFLYFRKIARDFSGLIVSSISGESLIHTRRHRAAGV
jgi:hypothetical protein